MLFYYIWLNFFPNLVDKKNLYFLRASNLTSLVLDVLNITVIPYHYSDTLAWSEGVNLQESSLQDSRGEDVHCCITYVDTPSGSNYALR